MRKLIIMLLIWAGGLTAIFFSMAHTDAIHTVFTFEPDFETLEPPENLGALNRLRLLEPALALFLIGLLFLNKPRPAISASRFKTLAGITMIASGTLFAASHIFVHNGLLKISTSGMRNVELLTETLKTPNLMMLAFQIALAFSIVLLSVATFSGGNKANGPSKGNFILHLLLTMVGFASLFMMAGYVQTVLGPMISMNGANQALLARALVRLQYVSAFFGILLAFIGACHLGGPKSAGLREATSTKQHGGEGL